MAKSEQVRENIALIGKALEKYDEIVPHLAEARARQDSEATSSDFGRITPDGQLRAPTSSHFSIPRYELVPASGACTGVLVSCT